MAERQCVLKPVNFGTQNTFCRQCVNFMPPVSLALISLSACHILDKMSVFYNIFSEWIVLLSLKIFNPFWIASWRDCLWIMAMLWQEFQNNSSWICHQNLFPVLVDDITWVETQLGYSLVCFVINSCLWNTFRRCRYEFIVKCKPRQTHTYIVIWWSEPENDSAWLWNQ